MATLRIEKRSYYMTNVSLVLLLVYLLLSIGCVSPQSPMGPVVCVIDTIDGKQYVVSAPVAADGKFSNSISKGNRTQTISGHAIKSGDKYKVTIEYNYVKADSPGVRNISTRIQLEEGKLQEIGGMDSDVIRIRISSD